FSVVDIGASGRQSDGGILKNSTFLKRLQDGTLNIPSGGFLPHTNIQTPYVLVGDEAFPLKPFLMKPYPGRNTSILPSDKNNELRMEDRQYCCPNYTDRENLNNGKMIPGAWSNDANNSLSSMGRASTNMYSNNAAKIRETFKKYFFHEGSVPWQWNICNVNMNDHEINNGN
ncbi:hypothetical protein CBL_20393, partial [Carabus blaptoides fortunei]